jgi:hypothetical protein
MKKVLLVAAMLIIAAPVMATVTVTATDKGGGVVEVSYNCTAAEAVRAFALDITVDNGLVINNIRDFNRGESKVPGGGYGIFPGRFANYINASSPNWADTNYTPIGRSTDPNTQSGLGTGAITVELGTLYVGPNSPGPSGLLFRLDVNTNSGAHDGNLLIALNGTRGGIVTEDANLAPSPVLTGTKVTLQSCIAIPNIVGMVITDANNAILNAGLAVGTATGAYSCAAAANVVISQDTGSCVASGTPVNYTYSLGMPVVPNVVGSNMTDANTAITNGGFFTIGVITYEPNCLKTPGSIDRQSPAAGTVAACGTTINYVVDTNGLYAGRVFTLYGSTTFTVTSAMVNTWNALGQPNCWCCASQKRGNGVYTGSSATKTDAVDLAQVKNTANFNKNDTTSNACLDFNLSGKIDAADLAIVKNTNNFNKVTGAAPPCQ